MTKGNATSLSSPTAVVAKDKMDPLSLKRRDPQEARETTVGFLENSQSKIKRKSPTNVDLIKDSIKSSFNGPEAASQLKVLCRKFAALSEKVKEETKIREEAEREVRRMKEMIEKMSTPVIGSCRSDAQVFVKELKETVELLKEELHFEKEKNAMLVTKAMELEREKNCYLNTSSCDSITNSLRQSQSQWDREQMHKIQETLKKTIMELQEELTSKEQELADARERIAREKARVREFEKEFETKEKEIQLEKQQNLFLTKKLHENEIQLVNEKQNIDLMEQKLQEEKHLREAFQQQVDTLNEVNDALEKRSETLVRRLELNHSIVQECQELKIQLREAEIDQETLVRTIRNLKEEHQQREIELKNTITQGKMAKAEVEKKVKELETDIHALKTQNSLFSEWMLIRNENTQSQAQISPTSSSPYPPRIYPSTTSSTSTTTGISTTTPSLSLPPQEQLSTATQRTTHMRVQVRPFSYEFHEEEPSSSEETRQVAGIVSSMTSGSGVSFQKKGFQPQLQIQAGKSSSPGKSPTKVTFMSSSYTVPTKKKKSPTLSDHERLRQLMARNKELQQRLLAETDATQQLEQEISSITSSYQNLLQTS